MVPRMNRWGGAVLSRKLGREPHRPDSLRTPSSTRHETSSLMTTPHIRVAAVAAALYLVVLLAIAFWPTPVDRPMSENLAGAIAWLHAHGMPGFIGYNQVEFAANIALFMPFGYLAGIWSRTWWHPVVAGLAASVLIELGQEVFLPDRFSSMFDIVANTLGATTGAGLCLLFRSRQQRRDKAPGSPPAGAAPTDC